MRGKRAIILCLLLLILTGVALLRGWPYLQLILGDKQGSVVAAAPQDVDLSRAARLKDGSFNPLPPVKAAIADDPTTLVETLKWRERYQAYLAKPAGPGFYVYPFLDRTPEGVGVHCTYGWHLTGTAALAQWTDARLTGRGEPLHYGLPLISETGPDQPPTLEDWSRQALADPAARDARYIIMGAYDYDAAGKRYTLRMKLLDRQTSGGQARDLVTSTSATRGDFNQLAAAQRAAARQLADQLIKLGLVHARPAPQAKGLELEKELGDVARLLDGSDSWAVMEGIDRALALANLFPKETMPLQAAAYGINALNQSYYQYSLGSNYADLYALRAYALSQVALAMNQAPALSQMNWAYSCVTFDHFPHERLKGITGEETSAEMRDLSWLYDIIVRNPEAQSLLTNEGLLPDWSMLLQELWQTKYSGRSLLRGYFNARLKYWGTHDLYLMALLQDQRGQGDYSGRYSFDSRLIGARYAADALTAAECAAILTAQGGGEATSQTIAMLADLAPVKREELARFAAARDYYRLRQSLMASFWNWDVKINPSHPMIRLLTHLEAITAELVQDPRQQVSLSGFAGIEFTPAERVEFNRRRDGFSTLLVAEQGNTMRAVFEEMTIPETAYLKARPTNASAYCDYGKFLLTNNKRPEAPALSREAYKQAYQLLPLESMHSFEVGVSYFHGHDPKTAQRYLTACLRTNPFDVGINKDLGDLYRRLGYHAKAVKCYDEYLKAAPNRYDSAIERAWSLCQMGHWRDPEVRAAFARPAPLLPGNGTFHDNNVEYLQYWAEETTSTRAALQFYRQAQPDSVKAIFWQVSFEIDDGKTTKALEMLNQAQVTLAGLRVQSPAVWQAQLARTYISLNRLDLAEKHLLAARGADEWQGNVIVAMAEMAFAKKDYDEAIKQYQREIERYDFSADAFLGIIECLEKKGERDRAIALLEEKVFSEEQRDDPSPALCRRLMRLYVEAKRPERTTELMQMVVKAPSRTRGDVMGAAENYKKAHPKEAEEIQKNIDRIMAGPEE